MAALATYVHVVNADGNVEVFGPGDIVPGWAAKLITNPKAWADGATGAPEPEAPKRGPGRPAKTAKSTDGE